MKTVEEVRRLRLTLLKEEFGTLVAINEKLGLDKRDSTLSQIVNSAKNSKTQKGKEMGSPLARRLEGACGKDVGWMDTDPDLLQGSGRSTEADAIAAMLDQMPPGDDRDHIIRTCRELITLTMNTLARSDEPKPTEAPTGNVRGLANGRRP